MGDFQTSGSPLWVAALTTGEVFGCIVAALGGLLFYKHFRVQLPWICAAAAAVVLSVSAYTADPQLHGSTPSLADVYSTVHSIMPYYQPFYNAVKDYSLFDDIPEFIQLQRLFILPFIAGGVIELAYRGSVYWLSRRYKGTVLTRNL